MNNKTTICSENTCTLCKACVSICPVGCVALKKDDLNNEYAVKGEKCINCNLCEKVCPANKETEFDDIKKCYAAWSLNSIIRKQSASGGIATELYRYELQHMSGAVVGVMYVDKGKIQESGSHEELLLNKGPYYNLFMSQYSFMKDKAVQ